MTRKIPEHRRRRHWKEYESGEDAEILRPYSAQIATTLANVRHRKWISQQALAKAVGLPQSVISYIESGWANTRLLNIIKVANYLEVPMETLFKDSRKFIQIYPRETLE